MRLLNRFFCWLWGHEDDVYDTWVKVKDPCGNLRQYITFCHGCGAVKYNIEFPSDCEAHG